MFSKRTQPDLFGIITPKDLVAVGALGGCVLESAADVAVAGAVVLPFKGPNASALIVGLVVGAWVAVLPVLVVAPGSAARVAVASVAFSVAYGESPPVAVPTVTFEIAAEHHRKNIKHKT